MTSCQTTHCRTGPTPVSPHIPRMTGPVDNAELERLAPNKDGSPRATVSTIQQHLQESYSRTPTGTNHPEDMTSDQFWITSLDAAVAMPKPAAAFDSWLTVTRDDLVGVNSYGSVPVDSTTMHNHPPRTHVPNDMYDTGLPSSHIHSDLPNANSNDILSTNGQTGQRQHSPPNGALANPQENSVSLEDTADYMDPRAMSLRCKAIEATRYADGCVEVSKVDMWSPGRRRHGSFRAAPWDLAKLPHVKATLFPLLSCSILLALAACRVPDSDGRINHITLHVPNSAR